MLVSVASLLDLSLAPEGCHVVHAYVPATEPYETWEGLDRKSKEYREQKAEAAEVNSLEGLAPAPRQPACRRSSPAATPPPPRLLGPARVLWRAVERQIPDVRSRAKVTLVGSPLTHERFLRRDRGTYGAFIKAGAGQLPVRARRRFRV